MKNVSKTTFEANCRTGKWECVWEPNDTGVAEVRNCRTGKRFMVRVTDW